MLLPFEYQEQKRIKKKFIIKLLNLGFQIKLTSQVRPCIECNTETVCYYNPETKKWMCEECIWKK